MNVYAWSGSILAILTYFPFWHQILKKKVSQNFITWMLWCILDVIAAVSIIFQRGNFFLPAAYTAGGLVVVLCIIKTGNRAFWSRFDTLVSFLVAVCMIIWYFSGDKMATVASGIAGVIAAFPQTRDAWKKPQEMPFLVYVSYLIANILSVAGGKNWSVEERFYSMACTALCAVMIIFTVRKFWQKPKTDIQSV
jgi:uncharacterized membrane protein